MPWRDIHRNLPAGRTIALVGNTKTSTADKLYAIVRFSGSAQFHRLTGAQQSPISIWSNTGANLPEVSGSAITITGSAYNPDMDQIYIVNSAQGKVYVWNDLTNSWGTTWSGSSTSVAKWNGYAGSNARLRHIVYSNGALYLAHRSGVSSLNTRISGSQWQLATEFSSAQTGPGECAGLAIQNNVLYVTVENYSAVYKNNDTPAWDKVAILPDYSVKPQHMASTASGIFITADDINTNLYRTDKIESVTTIEPTFRDGLHLSAPASSILTSQDGTVWLTTSTVAHTTDTINAFGNNLITGISNSPVVDVYQGNNESLSSRFHDTADSRDTSTASTPDGIGIINSTITPQDASISLQSNGIQCISANIVPFQRVYYTDAMTLLSDTTYRLTFGASGDSTLITAAKNGHVFFTAHQGAYFFVTVGIASADLNSFDASVPVKTFDFSAANLASSVARAASSFINQENTASIFEFLSNSLQTRTNVRLRILVNYAITTPGDRLNTFKQGTSFQVIMDTAWSFNLKLKSLAVTRANGTALIGIKQYTPMYIAQDLTQVPQADVSKHLITSPTPPDNWFIRFDSPKSSDLNSFRYFEIVRQVSLNPVTLKANTKYRFNINVLRERAINTSIPLKFTITSSVYGLSGYQATISSTNSYPIIWEFTTPNLSAISLQNVSFTLKAFEQDASLGEAAPVLFSDISFVEIVSGTPTATIYQIVDGNLDSTRANLAVREDDTAITLGDTSNLIETWESASQAYRKYLLSNGNVYVWEVPQDDPFDYSQLAKCVICC